MPAKSHEEIITEYRSRRNRQVLFTIVWMCYLGILFSNDLVDRWIGGCLFAVGVIAFLIVTALNWRCPNCGMSFMQTVPQRQCPHCKVPFRDPI